MDFRVKDLNLAICFKFQKNLAEPFFTGPWLATAADRWGPRPGWHPRKRAWPTAVCDRGEAQTSACAAVITVSVVHGSADPRHAGKLHWERSTCT